MKILFVCKAKPHIKEGVVHFISDQSNTLQKLGIDVTILPIPSRGIKSYISGIKILKKEITKNKFDIIHAHNGLNGLLANFQRKIPVVTTFHGSDINFLKTRFFSVIAARLSTHSIFISEQLCKKAGIRRNYSIIPCGVDSSLFKVYSKEFARQYFNFDMNEKIILFSGNFKNKVKNPNLALKVMESLPIKARLIELKDFTREEVVYIINASDLVLLTSFSEGSPQLVKEAMACNTPIVATDVGDIKVRLANATNCYITGWNYKEIADCIIKVFNSSLLSNGREEFFKQDIDSEFVGKKIIDIYKNILY